MWVKIRGYTTLKSGLVNKRSYETVYAYSSVGLVNTSNQRQSLFKRALNKALATYREHQTLDSDSEINYVLLDDGIQYMKEGRRLGWKQSRITPLQKREAHRLVNTGTAPKKDIPVTKREGYTSVRIKKKGAPVSRRRKY